jgi:DNA-binding XRE family transcriptional regulator
MQLIHDQTTDTLTIQLTLTPTEKWQTHPTDQTTEIGYAGNLITALRVYHATAQGALPMQINGDGNPVKALRLALGLTQTEFAFVTGVDRRNIGMLEIGKHKWNIASASKHLLNRVQDFLRHRTLGSVQPDFEKRISQMKRPTLGGSASEPS